MSNLISGKEALILKLSGEDVQFNLGGLDWQDLTDRDLNYWQGERYLNPDLNYNFRLKPKTILINGVEVPAPFKPKDGEVVFFISDDHDCGYCSYEWVVNHSVVFGVWRTEDEIKQVVDALRKVFNQGEAV